MGGYGYNSRKDPETRVVPAGSGQSRVTEPSSSDARRVSQVAKEQLAKPAAGGALDSIVNFPPVRPTDATWIGDTNIAAGTASFGHRWTAALFRYSRGATSGGSLNEETYGFGFEPRALVDPVLPASGIIVRIRDQIRAVFAGAVNAQCGKAMFGVGATVNTTADTNPANLIMFRCRYTVLNVQPTWVCYYSSFNGADLQQFDTGLKCDTLRLLEIEFNGKTQTINWYIDGVLQFSYSPISGTVGGQTTARPFLLYYLAFGGAGAGDSCVFDFLLGGPPMTYQFPDA